MMAPLAIQSVMAAAPLGVRTSNVWMARDYERLPDTVKGLHFFAFAILMLANFVHLVAFCS
jgi:hypothetical protein